MPVAIGFSVESTRQQVGTHVHNLGLQLLTSVWNLLRTDSTMIVILGESGMLMELPTTADAKRLAAGRCRPRCSYSSAGSLVCASIRRAMRLRL